MLGSSSKEHTLIWKLIQSPKYQNIEIIAIPGNAAIHSMAGQTYRVESLADINPLEINRVLEIAIARNVSLTVCGISELFYHGIVDRFREAQLAICGPTKAAAEIEWSHYFAKELMFKHNIPSAKYVSFDNKDLASVYLNTAKFPLILKNDNPFIEKQENSVFAKDIGEAHKALEHLFTGKSRKGFFAKLKPETSKARVVIEEFVEGQVFTISTICDGKRSLSLPPVQAYRSINGAYFPVNDMGAYAPTPIISDEIMSEIREKIINPSMAALEAAGRPYTGILSFDIVLSKDETQDSFDTKLLQYRTNLADSDAQVMLPLLDEDLLDVLLASAKQNLTAYEDGFHRYLGSALSVSVMSEPVCDENFIWNYDQIIDDYEAIKNFDKNMEDAVLMSFGSIAPNVNARPLLFYGERQKAKVLGATALAENLVDAQILAYKLAETVELPGKYYQKNIGDQGMI